MVVDQEIVRDRISRMRRYVADLRDFAGIDFADFRSNRERQYAVQHALQLAIEAALEIGAHICAADALGVPATYAETFGLLENAGVLESQLAERLRAMARFRNRLVHFYWNLDLAEVYKILRDNLDDFDLYVIAIEKYLTGPAAPPQP